jgi:hypothetical protein
MHSSELAAGTPHIKCECGFRTLRPKVLAVGIQETAVPILLRDSPHLAVVVVIGPDSRSGLFANPRHVLGSIPEGDLFGHPLGIFAMLPKVRAKTPEVELGNGDSP